MRLPLPTMQDTSVNNALLRMATTASALAKARYAKQQQHGIGMQDIGYGQNALAQGKYAPQQQKGIAEQETGAGKTSQAQGNWANKFFGGQAQSSVGVGQQERAAGQQAPAQEAATTSQLQGAAKYQKGMAKYVNQSQRSIIAQTTTNAAMQMLHNMLLAGATPPAMQQAINQMTASIHAIDPNAPPIKISPAGWFNKNNATPTQWQNTKVAPGTTRSYTKNGKRYMAIYNGTTWNTVGAK